MSAALFRAPAHARPRALPRRLTALLAAGITVAAAAVSAVTTTGAASAATPTGIVQRTGAQLTLDGSPYAFTGYQIGLASSPAHPLCAPYSDSDVSTELAKVHQSSGANAVRVWMFQGYGGPQDWSRFDLIFSEARKAGVKVLATLTNEWGSCEPSRPDGLSVVKTLPWFQSGYRSPDPGYALSFRDFVGAMANRYKAEPALLAWQLVNEAETKNADGSCSEAAGASALRAFSDDLVGVVRAAGDPHLVGLGTMGGGQCGAAGSTDFRYVHAGALDMCEYHDYTAMSAMPGDQWNGLATRLADCAAVGKPLFVGEAGVPAGIQADGSVGAVTADTLARRASLFDSKLTQQTAAGVAGYLVWQRSASNGDGYTVFDGDPVEAVLLQHAPAPAPAPTTSPTATATTSPTPTTSPSPSPTATSTATTGTTTVVTTVTTLLSRTTSGSGTSSTALTTGAGRLLVGVKAAAAYTMTVTLRDSSGRVLASARGALPLIVSTMVSAGRQTVTVSGPKRVPFTLSATYVMP